MPIVQIALLEGASDDQRRAVIASVTDAVADSLSLQPAAVRVLLHDIAPINWGAAGAPLADKKPG